MYNEYHTEATEIFTENANHLIYINIKNKLNTLGSI